jgi:hypothetical protein
MPKQRIAAIEWWRANSPSRRRANIFIDEKARQGGIEAALDEIIDQRLRQ